MPACNGGYYRAGKRTHGANGQFTVIDYWLCEEDYACALPPNGYIPIDGNRTRAIRHIKRILSRPR